MPVAAPGAAFLPTASGERTSSAGGAAGAAAGSLKQRRISSGGSSQQEPPGGSVGTFFQMPGWRLPGWAAGSALPPPAAPAAAELPAWKLQ